jgi:hypothetical protein
MARLPQSWRVAAESLLTVPDWCRLRGIQNQVWKTPPEAVR